MSVRDVYLAPESIKLFSDGRQQRFKLTSPALWEVRFIIDSIIQLFCKRVLYYANVFVVCKRVFNFVTVSCTTPLNIYCGKFFFASFVSMYSRWVVGQIKPNKCSLRNCGQKLQRKAKLLSFARRAITATCFATQPSTLFIGIPE